MVHIMSAIVMVHIIYIRTNLSHMKSAFKKKKKSYLHLKIVSQLYQPIRSTSTPVGDYEKDVDFTRIRKTEFLWWKTENSNKIENGSKSTNSKASGRDTIDLTSDGEQPLPLKKVRVFTETANSQQSHSQQPSVAKSTKIQPSVKVKEESPPPEPRLVQKRSLFKRLYFSSFRNL